MPLLQERSEAKKKCERASLPRGYESDSGHAATSPLSVLVGRESCRASDCSDEYQTLAGNNVAIQALLADEIRVVQAAEVDLAFLTATLK
jgi:hypothetical protein